ncbi:hypothetical protein BH10CHL1_BH10CHL1_21410 [soil metagenome]
MDKTSVLIAGNPADDLAIAEAMTKELEDYLVDNDLYRTIVVRTSEGDQRLQMTGGDLLTRLHRLQATRASLTPDQQARLDAAQKAAEETIRSLRTRFHERLQREMKARLDALTWYLGELGQDPVRARTEFPFEMRNRQRIEEILQEIGDDVTPELKNGLSQVDHRIRMLTSSGQFTWDEQLKAAFPPHPYWYLYVMP